MTPHETVEMLVALNHGEILEILLNWDKPNRFKENSQDVLSLRKHFNISINPSLTQIIFYPDEDKIWKHGLIGSYSPIDSIRELARPLFKTHLEDIFELTEKECDTAQKLLNEAEILENMARQLQEKARKKLEHANMICPKLTDKRFVLSKHAKNVIMQLAAN